MDPARYLSDGVNGDLCVRFAMVGRFLYSDAVYEQFRFLTLPEYPPVTLIPVFVSVIRSEKQSILSRSG